MAKSKMFRTVAQLATIAAFALSAGALMPSSAQATATNMALTEGDIFSSTTIASYAITIDPAGVSKLNNDPTNYVGATITISAPNRTAQTLNVGIRLKGSTSMQKLDQQPSFKIKFDYKASGHPRFLNAFKRMTLNAMTQDTSKLHEYASYLMFRNMNVPAPRTGWGLVTLNGANKGLYSNIETEDEIFVGKHYKDVTQHIYEGTAFADVNAGNESGTDKSGPFLVDYGYKAVPNKYDLAALINANQLSGAAWYKAMAKVSDRAEMIREFAVENFVGHWDGYSGVDINNYYLRSNSRGVFSIQPWGTDQTFGEDRNQDSPTFRSNFFYPLVSQRSNQPWMGYGARGMMYVKCVRYAPCLKEYLLDLKATSAKATSIKLTTLMANAAKVVNTFGQVSADQIREQKRTIAWVGAQQKNVLQALKDNGIK